MTNKTAWHVLENMFPGSGADILDRLDDGGFAVVSHGLLDKLTAVHDAIEAEIVADYPTTPPVTGD